MKGGNAKELVKLIGALRRQVCDGNFVKRHRARPEDLPATDG
jgi:hypothetical protein